MPHHSFIAVVFSLSAVHYGYSFKEKIMFIKKLHTPEGAKDYLPDEMMLKKDTEKKIEKLFERYGYSMVKAPVVEFYEVFENTGSVSEKNMYKFVDADGSLTVLRPDMTPAIARIAATSYSKEDMPLRFCYIEDMFRRNKNYQGKQSQFTQAGAELIGEGSVYSDVEILTLAVESMLYSGVKNFRIDIGHSDFLPGLLDEAGATEEQKQKIIFATEKKDYVTVSETADSLKCNDSTKALIKRLHLLIGDEEMLEATSKILTGKKALDALTYLSAVNKFMKDLGYGEYICCDLSTVATMDYYTGLCFRGYAKGIGFSVIDGGRYDKLLSSFGEDLPAVGFAIKINDIMSVSQNRIEKKKYVVIDGSISVKRASLAKELRNAGITVITLFDGLSCDEILKRHSDCTLAVYAGNEIVISKNGETKTVKDVSEIIKEVL